MLKKLFKKIPKYTIIRDKSTFYEEEFHVVLFLNNTHLKTFLGTNHVKLIQDAFDFARNHSFENKHFDFNLKFR